MYFMISKNEAFIEVKWLFAVSLSIEDRGGGGTRVGMGKDDRNLEQKKTYLYKGAGAT